MLKSFLLYLSVFIVPLVVGNFHFHGIQGSWYAAGFIVGMLYEMYTSRKYRKAIIEQILETHSLHQKLFALLQQRDKEMKIDKG